MLSRSLGEFCTPTHIYNLWYDSLRHDDHNDNRVAESSKANDPDNHSDEDTFADVVVKNAMPTPPSKAKKEFLEDFENFTVEYVGILICSIQDYWSIFFQNVA